MDPRAPAMGNFILAVVRDFPDFVGVLAHQPPVFRGSARAVGGGDAGSRSAEPPGLRHRVEFDGPVPASAGVGHGADFGCDRGRARTFEQWADEQRAEEQCAATAGGRAADGSLFRARHHGGVRRVVLLVSAVESGEADGDRAAANGGVGRAGIATGMDFRTSLGCVAAGGGHASVLLYFALALV